MVTYYTALGRMVSKYENGCRIPSILIEDTEYDVSVDELIIWGSLHWNFMVKETLEREYGRRKAQNRIFTDTSFERTLNRLKTRGLIADGTDYLAADALYNLISTLKITPVKTEFIDKLKSMAYFYFIKGVPFKECFNSYFSVNTTPDERNVLKLSKNVGITLSEIIKCSEERITDIQNDADIMEKVYSDRGNDFSTLAVKSRFSTLREDLIKAVANLYMKKKIIFEN